jgi:hypothetical protein
MSKYLLYGKRTRNLYSMVNGELADALAAGQRLRRIHPQEDFYVLTADENASAGGFSNQELEQRLSTALRLVDYLPEQGS